jgi:YggT family protein
VIEAWQQHWKTKELIVIIATVIWLVNLVFTLFYYTLFARVIFSFLQLGRDANLTLLQVRRYTHLVTEPILAPIRKIIKPVHIGGGGYLDLSPLIVIILLPYIQRVIINLLYNFF